MPQLEQIRLFISYAHRDGAGLATRLQKDLAAGGFDVWLDTRQLAGGAAWTTEIENEIDARQVTIALLTVYSYKSEICRAEQLRALRQKQSRHSRAGRQRRRPAAVPLCPAISRLQR